jgi:hypothetical protein
MKRKDGKGKPRYGLPTLRSTVVRLSPLLCYEDRDPLFLVSFPVGLPLTRF